MKCRDESCQYWSDEMECRLDGHVSMDTNHKCITYTPILAEREYYCDSCGNVWIVEGTASQCITCGSSVINET